MSDGKTKDDAPAEKPANVAPDAVKDPNEKTGGKPGMGPEGEKKPRGEPSGDADPGGG